MLESSYKIVRSRVLIALTAAALLLTIQLRTAAHEIPNDVTVQMFMKPVGDRLQLIVRVPLRAMRDIDIPTRGPGYLDLARAEKSLNDAAVLWISNNIELYEGEMRLFNPTVARVRAALESDRSFDSYERALAHLEGPPLPKDTEMYWNQGLLDMLFEYPIQSESSRFSIHPDLAGLGIRVVTVLRFLPSSDVVRAFEFEGDPGLVRLDPSWYQASFSFVKSGFFHILDGTDHLLFLFCLVIPLRRFRPLIAVVTSFTLAHSITLIASAYNLGPDALWFPPLIETLIAISIVYMALENIVGRGVGRRWMIAFAFGLVHGFGFSFALRQTLQFAGSHLLTSLLSFNIGVEIGQILVLALLIPALQLLFRFVVAERMGTIILSALVAHTGWHWMLERGSRLSQFGWPAFNAALLVTAMRWMMAIVIVAGLLWLVSLFSRRITKKAERESERSDSPEVTSEQALAMRATDGRH